MNDPSSPTARDAADPGHLDDVCVIIVEYRAADALAECLAGLSSDGPPPRTIIVDNASGDGAARRLAEDRPWAEVVELDRNRGFGAANNVAWGLGDEAYVLFLNPDTVPSREAVRELRDWLAAHEDAGAVGPKIARPDGSTEIFCRRTAMPIPSFAVQVTGVAGLLPETWRMKLVAGHTDYDSEGYAQCVSGSCMMVRREALDGEPPFDERFFLYAEDLDLCMELAERGWRIGYTPKARVVHTGGVSTGRALESAFPLAYRAYHLLMRKRRTRAHAAAARAISGVAGLLRGTSALARLVVRPDDIARDRLAAARGLLEWVVAAEGAGLPRPTLSFVCAVTDEATARRELLASKAVSSGRHDVVLKRGHSNLGAALNEGVAEATGDVVVVLHQDVRLPPGWERAFFRSLARVEREDPDWAVLGVAGVRREDDGTVVEKGHVWDRSGRWGSHIGLPQPVDTLDELLLVLRRGDGFGFDEALPGPHMYGADICVQARVAGRGVYAIDAYCEHNSRRPVFDRPPDFLACVDYMRDKWRDRLPIATTCTVIEP